MPEEEPALTEEEMQILRLVAEGWTDKHIARELRLSRTTVHRRLHRAGKLLGATSRINLVLRAVEAGIIRSPGAAGSKEVGDGSTEGGAGAMEE